MASADFDPDMYTKMLNLTEPYHRSVYPSVSPTNPSISFAGKVVLVTGASRGVGFGIAPVFAEAGAAGVVVTARQVSSLETVTAAIKEKNAKTEVLALACDVSDNEAVKKVFSEIKEKFGRLDLVVANAGTMSQGETFPKIGDEATLKVWTTDINTNIFGTYYTAQHYISLFGPTGVFLSLTSGAAALTIPGMSSYGISKHSCIKIVEFLAVEHPEMRVYAVNPGLVKESDSVPAFKPFAQDEVALVGGFMLWLASGKADAFKGCTLSVNWDVDVLERNAEKIKEGALLKTSYLGYKFMTGAPLLE